MFITFEGPDGSGKTTALAGLVDFLKKEGISFVLTREPGTQEYKESAQIREILISKDNSIPDITEALLFAADRSMHIEKLIKPALDEGKIVLCDRYVDSSFAYQGFGREIGYENIKKINDVAIKGIYPDITIFFDISPIESEKRVDSRAPKDRIEKASSEFKERVYKGYKFLIKEFPQRFKVIDATKSKEEVLNEVKNIILNAIKNR